VCACVGVRACVCVHVCLCIYVCISDFLIISMCVFASIRAVEPQTGMSRVGQKHKYVRCIYGSLCKDYFKCTAMCGVHIRFWPTLGMKLV
jgi:hypothetical protein